MTRDATKITVEVVRTQLTTAGSLDGLIRALSDEEKVRAAAYKVEEARRVFILARGLLRLELAERLGREPETVHFDVRPSGKPDLRRTNTDQPDWRFSVSHTGKHIVLAFALGVDVGVDIERLDREVEILSIARRYFTPLELATLEACPPHSRARAFFAGWTRKEAVVKARGLTMAESLATLSVDLDPANPNPGYEDSIGVEPRAACRMTSFEFPDEALMGAVAVRSRSTPQLRIAVLNPASFD